MELMRLLRRGVLVEQDGCTTRSCNLRGDIDQEAAIDPMVKFVSNWR